MKKAVLWAIGLGIFAAFLFKLFTLKERKEMPTTNYELTQDNGTPVGYDDFDVLIANIFYDPQPPANIKWRVQKFVPVTFNVEVGKDGDGYYHKDPYGTGQRISSSVEANEAWLHKKDGSG